MNLADMFLQQLAREDSVSPVLRKLGEALAEKHKEALETTAEFAKRQCASFYEVEAMRHDLTRALERNAELLNPTK